MTVLLLHFLLILLLPQLRAQQTYVNNRQLACNVNWNETLGFVCNASPSCTSYLTFRSTPIYNTPTTIAPLLSADASQIASANSISASYTLTHAGETYFSVANETYQALTTCQSMEAQNPYNITDLAPEMRLAVPLRCACPTPTQISSGYHYLLTYLVRQGNTYESIAAEFAGAGADIQGILDANMLAADQIIYFFTPLLVPLKIQPTKDNINTVASPPPPPTSTPPSGASSSNKPVFIGVGIGAALLAVLSSVFLIWFFRYRRPRNRESPLPPPKLADESGYTAAPSSWSISSDGIQSAIETLTLYKFEEIEKATDSFNESNRISGSSSVYLASFKGDDAVIKMMKGDVSKEIDVLRQINHSRIIRLSGYCLHQGITYLVYEYAEKGSLAEWLHRKKSLDWKQRVQVVYDVADALNYLHNFTNPPYIHKNLTSSNILLDSNMRAKVGNFGQARTMDEQKSALTRHVVGTYGYMAPEYIESGLVSPKVDVFALGVVMLEVLSGKEAVGKVMLWERIEGVLDGENVREKVKDFMDVEEYPLEVAYAMCELAKMCVARNLDARPSLSEVFMTLSKILSSSLDWDPSNDDLSVSFSE